MAKSAVRKPRLGRGLASLMVPVAVSARPPEAEPRSEADPASARQEVVHLDVGALRPNPNQPRQNFASDGLERLARSIASAGVMQPVIVRPLPDGRSYELVAGERRWRAAQLAHLERMPAIIRDLDEREVAEWSLVENLQREDLNPIERALAFRRLISKFELSHEQIGQRVGVERSTITNTLRLLSLDEQVRQMVAQGLLSGSQAKVIAGLQSVDQQRSVASLVVKQNLPVRRIERMVRQLARPDPTGEGQLPPPRKAHLQDLERQISEQLGARSRLKPGRKKGTGTLSIEFYSLEHFESLLQRLGLETAAE